MRTAFVLFALGLCPLTTGCRLAVHVARNLAYEPMRYADDVAECCRNEWLARDAWAETKAANPGHEYSPDYARGFKDGYADYLRNRGPGAPPPVPPKCYWNAHYQSPAGHRAIEDWYAGFVYGAGAARESLRAPFLTVPTHAEGPDALRSMAWPEMPYPEAGAPDLPHPKPLPGLIPEPIAPPKKDPVPEGTGRDAGTARPMPTGDPFAPPGSVPARAGTPYPRLAP